MCNVVDQMLETGRSEGIEIGKNEGRIQGSIETYQEMNVGYDNTQFYIEMKINNLKLTIADAKIIDGLHFLLLL